MKALSRRVALNGDAHPRAPSRLSSLDAFRGFIILCMISNGFGFEAVADKLSAAGQSSPLFDFLANQFSHVAYVGCSFWDLIQPGFYFIVGMAIPYSLAGRATQGATPQSLIRHALRRSIILFLLGIFLSIELIRLAPDLNWHLYNVLTQIGLGYTCVFFLANKSLQVQLTSLVAILGGYWMLFVLWPVTNDSAIAPVNELLYTPQALFSHWQLNANVALQFDRFYLNLWSRPEPYFLSRGGYQTLNFIPSIGSMLIGVMIGNYLLKSPTSLSTVKGLVIFGLVCLLTGYLLGQYACPIVKRLWTPSWTLFSSGWVILGFAGFYLISDILRVRRWETPFLVLGRNPITLYMLYNLFAGPAAYVFQNYLLVPWKETIYLPTAVSVIIIVGLWAIAYEMNRRKIFIRI